MGPLGRYKGMRTTRCSVTCLAALLVLATACDTTPGREKQAINEIHTGDATACAEEKATMERAVETYMLLNPDKPINEAAIVAAGILHQTSTLMDVMSNGAVVPAAGTVCS